MTTAKADNSLEALLLKHLNRPESYRNGLLLGHGGRFEASRVMQTDRAQRGL